MIHIVIFYVNEALALSLMRKMGLWHPRGFSTAMVPFVSRVVVGVSIDCPDSHQYHPEIDVVHGVSEEEYGMKGILGVGFIDWPISVRGC